MGYQNSDSNFNSSVGQLREGLYNFFLGRLKTLGLATQQISTQTSEELETSLETVNDAIQRVNSFGVFSVRISAEGDAIVAASKTESHFEIAILPLLLESKKLILKRLAELRKREQIDNLEQLVNRVSDESLQEKLSLELSNLNAQSALWRNKLEEFEKQQSQEIDKLQTYSNERIDRLTNDLKSIRHGRAIYRILLGLLIGILGIIVIIYFPYLLNWQGLLNHPKKFSIQVSLCLIILGLCWAIVDSSSNRRWFAFGSIVLAASLGLLGLL